MQNHNIALRYASSPSIVYDVAPPSIVYDVAPATDQITTLREQQ
jgi:hypothetical protein